MMLVRISPRVAFGPGCNCFVFAWLVVTLLLTHSLVPANYVQIVQQQPGAREGVGGGGSREEGSSGNLPPSLPSLSVTPTNRHRDTEEESLLTD